MSGYSLFLFIIEASVALAALFTLVLLFSVLFVRARNAYVRSRRERLAQRWRAIFTTAYTDAPPPDELPPVRDEDWYDVMLLFERFHELREHDRERAHEVLPKLDTLGRRAGLDVRALSMLDRGDDADKILALGTLGHLKDVRAIDRALDLSAAEGGELSRTATQCVLRIDQRYIDGTLDLVAHRDDWIRSRVEAMLRDVDRRKFDAAIIQAVDRAVERDKPTLLDYVRLCSPGVARTIATRTLRDSQEPETIAAALRSLAPLASAIDHRIAVRYCVHESDIVKLSALRVLRHCVTPDDRDLLASLVGHSDYWIRVRAAEVVVALLGESARAAEFAAEQPDRYARDAIRQAVAERRFSNRRTSRARFANDERPQRRS